MDPTSSAVESRETSGRTPASHEARAERGAQDARKGAQNARRPAIRCPNLADCPNRQSLRLGDFMQKLDEGVVMADEAGVIQDVNTYFLDFVGMPRDALVGRKVLDLHSPGTPVYERVQGLLESFREDPTQPPFTLQRAIAGVELLLKVVPLSDGERFLGVVLNVIDVSELVAARRHAEAASQAKSTFLASMSHEIRTPLNGVIGMAEALEAEELSVSQREAVGIIRTCGSSLLSVLNGILDFSKIEAGSLELEEEPFVLRKLVEDCQDTLSAAARKKGVEVMAEIAEDVPRGLLGDEGRLRQVLVNLLGNAVKFTEEGTVSTSVEREVTDRGEHLRVSVTDTGPGMTEEVRQRLFLPFSQGDGSTSRRYGGTGLGLAISRRLVEFMGGEIGCESRPGEGSTFWFSIPSRPAEVEERSHSEDPCLAGKRILVVDDNAANRRVLDRQIRHFQALPTCAPDASSALDVLRRARTEGSRFDVLLLDHEMPGMDGVSLLEVIRMLPGMEEVPAVLVSSRALGRGDPRVEGFEAVLEKPLRRSRLNDALARVVGCTCGRKVEDHTAARSLRLLVAEDNPTNQRVAHLLFGRLGHEIELVENGQLALDAFLAAGDRPFDAVFLDLCMPEMDGFETARQIRVAEGGSGRRTPLVALTAQAFGEVRSECFEAGMDGYVPKPFQLEELEEALEEHVLRSPRSLPSEDRGASGVAAEHAGEDPEQAGVFDPAVFLRRVGGDWDAALELVEVFRADLEAQRDRLRTALARADASEVREAGHSLKGAAAFITGERVAELALSLQRTGESGDLELAAELFRELEEAAEELVQAIERACREQHA